MNMDARNQYLKVLQDRYFKAKSRKKIPPFWMSIARIPGRTENTPSGR